MDLSQFNDDLKNFEILAEECAELIQIKSKIARFGLFNRFPKGSVTNRSKLVQELGDVLAMIEILMYREIVNESELHNAMNNKLDKLKKWY